MISLYEWCKRYGGVQLLREWDHSRNDPLEPWTIPAKAKHRVWWRCEKGHAYQAEVCAKVAGSGCPICAGRLVEPGVNDLATRYPALAEEWHPTKNGKLTPDMFPPGSHQRVWWQDSLGHTWRAQIKSRTGGAGCPICAGKVILPGFNDLATTHPELAEEWHPAKNGSLTPEQVRYGMQKKVWWQCKKGHEWQATIFARARGTGCPYCTNRAIMPGENDFASSWPELAREWHPTKNGNLRPEDLTPYSNRRVWWVCSLGHEYRSAVSRRTGVGCGCPYCSGRTVLPGFNDLATLEPEIAKQWHPTLNEGLTPDHVTKGSRKKVWWQCPYGHVWQAVVYSRTGPKRCGCPVCAGTVSRKRIQRFDRQLDIRREPHRNGA